MRLLIGIVLALAATLLRRTRTKTSAKITRVWFKSLKRKELVNTYQNSTSLLCLRVSYLNHL